MNGFSMFHRHAISRNLALSLLLVLILGQGLLMGGIYVYESHRLTEQQNVWADDAIEKLRQVLVVPLWNFDSAQISRIGSGFFGNDQVVDLRIVDADGKILYGRQRPVRQLRRMHLPDGRAGQWLVLEGSKRRRAVEGQLESPGEIRGRHGLHLVENGPKLRQILLGEKIRPRGQNLRQLDEADAKIQHRPLERNRRQGA